MHSITSLRTRIRRAAGILAVFVPLVLVGCGGGSGGSSSGGDDGGGDSGTGVSTSDLAGTWGGTIESSSLGLATLTLDFDSGGNITGVAIGGNDQGLSAELEGTPTSSDRIFIYTIDETTTAIYVDEAIEHAGVLLADGTIGVIEKGTTTGSFASNDAAGSWAGESVFVVAPFEEDGIDTVTGGFTTTTGGVQSTDVEFSNSSGTCSDIQVSLLGFRSATGVYDSGTASGGTGTDCPAGTIPADAYVSYDANFMVIYAGCEANVSVDNCSLAILSRTGSDGGSDDDSDVDSSLTPSPIEEPFRVNTTTSLQQIDPSVTALSGGEFFVTWEDFLEGVRGRHYDGDATALTGELGVASDAGNPAAATLADGSVAVIYDGEHADDSDAVLGRVFDDTLSPIVSEFRVNTETTGDQGRSALASLAGGGFVATWRSTPEDAGQIGQDGDGSGVYAQLYSASGSRVGSEFQVNTETANDQSFPSAAGLATSGFVITWHSILQNGESAGIYGQRYDANGNPVGAEFQVNNEQLFSDPGLFTNSVAALPDGGFVVSWNDGVGDIHVRRFGSDGAPGGPQSQVNTTGEFTQYRPAVTALEGGGFVVIWKSAGSARWTVRGQRYNSSGSPVGNEFEIPTVTNDFGSHDTDPSIDALPSGGFVVAWAGDGEADGGVMVRRFAADGGGDGGSGDGGGDTDTTVDFSGSWSGSVTQSSDCGDDGTSSGMISISQSGDGASVSGWKLDGTAFSATVSGDTLSADSAFSYPDGAGETTETGWSATLDSSGDSFSGGSNFEYVDSGFSCSGTLTFSASKSS